MRCLNCHIDGIALDVVICPSCSAHLPSLLRDTLPNGQRIRSDGNYELNYPLGRGGFGITYRAFNHGLDVTVAIKEYFPQSLVMRHPETQMFTIPPDKQESYQRGLERFIKEGRILRKFSHPNIVRVEDIFQERDTAYLVMELVSGQSLKQYVKSKGGKLAEEEVVQIIGQVVEALSVVHEANFYHLDLKPDNILLTTNGQVKLIDFGAAKQELSGSRTHHSTMSFTEIYAPPELLAQEEVGRESDIFELGMLVHELLVGELPPPVMQRFFSGDKWQPEGIGEPWQTLIQQALLLEKSNRPSDIKQWWQRVKKSSNFFISSSSVLLPNEIISSTLLQNEKEQNESKIQKTFIEDLGDGVFLEMNKIPRGKFYISKWLDGMESEYFNYIMKNKFFNAGHCYYYIYIKDFYIGKYLITQRQWEKIMGYNPSYFKYGDSYPVDSVSWHACQSFLKKLSEKTGKNYRLPYEHEWEYACRAGTRTRYYFGDQITTSIVNYKSESNSNEYKKQTTRVGLFPANNFGLYDMHGNLWEWCDEQHETKIMPHESHRKRNLRGGSWYVSAERCTSSSRSWGYVNASFKDWGLRIVCDEPSLIS